MVYFHRALWSLLLILFSVQILGANFALEKCHHEDFKMSSVQTGAGQGPSLHGSHAASSATSQDSHCNNLGFCLSGHCHMSHCSVFISAGPVGLASLNLQKTVGLPQEDELISLWGLDRPWQPPRA